MPYTAAVDENTIRPTPPARAASSSAIPPATLSRKYRAGSAIDSATSERAAQWRMASIRSLASSRPSASPSV